MALDRRAAEAHFARALGVGVRLAAASRPAGPDRLTPRERRRLAGLPEGPRREAWLLGRAALKRVLAAFGEDEDTAALAFPNRRFSLTHGGGLAVAAGVPAEAALAGLGVDLEAGRSPRPEAARFFLTPEERRWLSARDPEARPAELLRLWTVKEAVFKACPDNAGTLLADYVLEDPAAGRGRATCGRRRSPAIRYASFRLDDGFVSMATCEGR